MSDLNVEDLKKLSVKQLEKFATGVDGEDLILVNEVLANKSKVMPIGGDRDGLLAAEQAKADAAQLKADIKAKAAAEKAVIDAEKQALKDKIAVEKAEAVKILFAEKEAAAIEKAEAKAKLVEAKAIAKAAVEANKIRVAEERAKLTAEKLAEKLAAKEARAAHVGVYDGSVSKTEAIASGMLRGLTNDEMEAETGFTRKFIRDTTWRLDRSVNFYIRKQKFLADQAGESPVEVTE